MNKVCWDESDRNMLTPVERPKSMSQVSYVYAIVWLRVNNINPTVSVE